MTKIKVISKEREIEGTIISKNVTPFGTASHIILAKKEIGKVVDVVIPKKAKYIWTLTAEQLQGVVNICNKIIENHNSKKKVYEQEAIANIQEKKFDLENLDIILDILSKNNKSPQTDSLIKRIKEFYNL